MFRLFLNFLVERHFLISVGCLFQKRIPQNKGEIIPWRLACAGERSNVFPFLKTYDKIRK